MVGTCVSMPATHTAERALRDSALISRYLGMATPVKAPLIGTPEQP